MFRRGLANTLVFTAAAVVLQTGIGLLLAVLVSETRRGGSLFRIAFVTPFILAPVAVGTVWRFLYAPFFGIVPAIGGAVGVDLSSVAPLGDPNTALWAIVLAFVWRFAGFSMVVYLAAMRSDPARVLRVRRARGDRPADAAPTHHVAAPVAADVRAHAAHDDRHPEDLRPGVDHDRGWP